MIFIACNLEYAKATTPEKVAEELKPFRPDVICLCEVPNGKWTAELARRLDMPCSVVGSIASANHEADYPDQTGRWFGKYKALVSRRPLRDAQEEPLNGAGWQPASIMLARTECDGVDVLAGALHIPTGREDPEQSCARALAELMETYDDARVVLGGDYNDLANSAPMEILYHAGFRNPWLETGFDFRRAKTCDAKTDHDAGVIDHLIFRGPLRAERAEILRHPEPQSDHYPILVELRAE